MGWRRLQRPLPGSPGGPSQREAVKSGCRWLTARTTHTARHACARAAAGIRLQSGRALTPQSVSLSVRLPVRPSPQTRARESETQARTNDFRQGNAGTTARCAAASSRRGDWERRAGRGQQQPRVTAGNSRGEARVHAAAGTGFQRRAPSPATRQQRARRAARADRWGPTAARDHVAVSSQKQKQTEHVYRTTQ